MLEIKKLELDYIDKLQEHFYKKASREQVQSFITDSNVVAYIATLENEVIGFIYGYILKRIDSEPMLYIHSVDVIKEYQGSGIGTKMMDKMLAIKKENNYNRIFLITNKSNEKAMGLYKKVGGVQPYNDDVVIEYR